MTSEAQSSGELVTCPKCGYDLTGVLCQRCPECGCPFDVNQIRRGAGGEATWDRPDWLLIATIVIGGIGYGFGGPHGVAKELTWAIVVWGLGFTWAALSWPSITRQKPWLALWLVGVALAANNRPHLAGRPEGAWLGYASAGVCAVIVGWVAVLAPWRVLRAGLLVLAILFWLCGGVLIIVASVALTGVELEGTYSVFGAEIYSGGLGDAIAGLLGVVLALLGWGVWWAAGNIRRQATAR